MNFKLSRPVPGAAEYYDHKKNLISGNGVCELAQSHFSNAFAWGCGLNCDRYLGNMLEHISPLLPKAPLASLGRGVLHISREGHYVQH